MKVNYIDKCRACGDKTLERFFFLEDMPFTDDFVSKETLGSEFLLDINIYFCKKCYTVQTQHDVNVDEYYQDYQYSVGSSSTASSFMNILAKNIYSKFFSYSKSKPKLLEIGSGDGEQLIAFEKAGFEILGYEPSIELCKLSEKKGINTIQGLFGENSQELLPASHKSLDVISLFYTFDHLPQPKEFLMSAERLLKDNGILVVEVHDLDLILERNEFCLFEHEHSIYLNEGTARDLCERNGLKVIDFNIVPTNERRANSLIFIACKKNSKAYLNKHEPKNKKNINYKNSSYLHNSSKSIKSSIKKLDDFLLQESSLGKKIAGYGAGGRGVMSLAACQNASSIKYVVDQSVKFKGCRLPKSGLRLEEVNYLEKDVVDLIIVFSFGYLEEIKKMLLEMGYKENQILSLLEILKI